MPEDEKVSLIGFRAPQSLRDKIEAERIALKTSMQDLIKTAIEQFLSHRAGGSQEIPAPVKQTIEDYERFKLTSLWKTYIMEMPVEKVELMVNVMELDLNHYRSSRRKLNKREPLRRRKPQGPVNDAQKS